jgi:hypothetical protein
MLIRTRTIIEILQKIILRDIQTGYSLVEFFLDNEVKGGWEAWLQVEFVRAAMETQIGSTYEFKREITYVGALTYTERCDLVFQGKIEDETKGALVWIELKTQTRKSDKKAVGRFTVDIQKILAKDKLFSNRNIAAAIVVLKLSKQYLAELDSLNREIESGTSGAWELKFSVLEPPSMMELLQWELATWKPRPSPGWRAVFLEEILDDPERFINRLCIVAFKLSVKPLLYNPKSGVETETT